MLADADIDATPYDRLQGLAAAIGVEDLKVSPCFLTFRSLSMSGCPLSQLLGAPTASLSPSSQGAADHTIVAAVSPKRKIAAKRDILPSGPEADVLE